MHELNHLNRSGLDAHGLVERIGGYGTRNIILRRRLISLLGTVN
jgi:hypothetical protein